VRLCCWVSGSWVSEILPFFRMWGACGPVTPCYFQKILDLIFLAVSILSADTCSVMLPWQVQWLPADLLAMYFHHFIFWLTSQLICVPCIGEFIYWCFYQWEHVTCLRGMGCHQKYSQTIFIKVQYEYILSHFICVLFSICKENCKNNLAGVYCSSQDNSEPLCDQCGMTAVYRNVLHSRQ